MLELGTKLGALRHWAEQARRCWAVQDRRRQAAQARRYQAIATAPGMGTAGAQGHETVAELEDATLGQEAVLEAEAGAAQGQDAVL